METHGADIINRLVSAIQSHDVKALSGLISDKLQHDFSRNGINVDCSSNGLAKLAVGVSEVQLTPHDIFAAGDKLVARFSFKVSSDAVPGAKPGTHADVHAIVIARIENDKIVEVWHEKDTAGMLLSLGLPVGKQ